MVPLEERKISQQELMIRTRQMLRKLPGRSHQRVRRHRHLRRVERAAAAAAAVLAAAARRRRRRWRFNRLNILIQGPDIEQLQSYTVQLMDKVRRDSRRRRRRHQLRADAARAARSTSIARARPTSA